MKANENIDLLFTLPNAIANARPETFGLLIKISFVLEQHGRQVRRELLALIFALANDQVPTETRTRFQESFSLPGVTIDTKHLYAVSIREDGYRFRPEQFFHPVRWLLRPELQPGNRQNDRNCQKHDPPSFPQPSHVPILPPTRTQSDVQWGAGQEFVYVNLFLKGLGHSLYLHGRLSVGGILS